jgi:LysR family transcriptional regulator, hydrogen peroxide-inducible genes activator
MPVDLSSMTLTQLRYVVAVDRHRSFRVAAEHCHVSQPGLSMQIQKLEEVLGLAIFDRSHQPVVTTERGAAIVAQARTVLHECERLGDLVHVGDELTGTYRLGVIPTLAPSLVPLLVPRFLTAYPRVALYVEERTTDELVRGLLDDSLDGGLAATPLDVPLIHERPLFLEPFYVYLGAAHPLCERSHLRQSDLFDERPWLLADGHCFRTQCLHLCKVDRRSAEASTMTRFETGSFETLVRLVDAGVGLTLLPELTVRGLPEGVRRRQVRPFTPPVPTRQISFVFGRDRLRGAIAEALVETLLSQLPTDLPGPGDAGDTWTVIPTK